MTNVLDVSLENRQRHIQTAKAYLEKTRVLFDAFGSAELKTSHAKFDELLDALNADQVRLVVIGEFSRGKSSLVNALLGIELLPTAMEATTAINTFIRALPAGGCDRFIRIHYQDNKPFEDMPWRDDSELVRWGTELDENHAHVRRTLDYIEVFMDHPLLQKGLVLIDTPGLESVMKHHEGITRKAIAEAHIALWVQNTTQLGGSASEWDFLSSTIRTNFSKFITVVNWWDKVLEPEDAQDQKKPESVRVREKMDKVKHNFEKHLEKQPKAEVDLLTNSDHLMGVSAKWALSKNPDLASRSGIAHLTQRIADMFSSGEAMEQIFRKPLQQLAHIQSQLVAGLTDEAEQLNSDKSLAERQRELESFEKDIKLLDEESKRVASDSTREHDFAAKHCKEEVRQKLVAPLADLKAEIEIQVNENYIKKSIDRGVKQIGLPASLDEQFHSISAQVAKEWEKQKQELAKVLEGLRADYTQQMAKHVSQIKGQMAKVDIELPSLNVRFDLDLSAIEAHHQKAIELQQEIAARRDQIDGIESDMTRHGSNNAELEMARQAVSRAERMIDQLGQQPAPGVRRERERVSKGGMWSDDKYATIERTDNSNVEAWKADRAEQKRALVDKESRMAQIAADEERKTGIRLSLDKAQKKYEREIKDFERKQAEFERREKEEKADLIHDTVKHLIKSTAGQLDQRISYLQDHAAEAIQTLFMNQLELLKGCVQEQYLEPLNAKRAKREEVQTLLQQNQAAIAQRKARLASAQDELKTLQTETQTALKA